MAHKGVFGPILDRRDFNLNVSSNAVGFPQNWNVFLGDLPLGNAHVLSGHGFLVGPDFQAAPSTVGWRSVPRAIGIFFWQIEMLATINPDGRSYTKTLEISVPLTASVWKIGYAVELDDVERPNFRGFPKTIFWNPLYFNQEPNPFIVFIFFRRWGDPVPH